MNPTVMFLLLTLQLTLQMSTFPTGIIINPYHITKPKRNIIRKNIKGKGKQATTLKLNRTDTEKSSKSLILKWELCSSVCIA